MDITIINLDIVLSCLNMQDNNKNVKNLVVS